MSAWIHFRILVGLMDKLKYDSRDFPPPVQAIVITLYLRKPQDCALPNPFLFIIYEYFVSSDVTYE